MNHPSSGSHPLHTAVFKVALITEVVFVEHVAVEHIGHGFKTAMGMRRKTCKIVGRLVRKELVQHEKRIMTGTVRLAKTALELNARAV
jgi:hypothetical protein